MRPGTSNAAILKHYRMNELFPTQWEDHESDRPVSANGRPSSAGGLHRQGASHRRTGSGRYSVLQESNAIKRVSGGSGLNIPGTVESNVPQDEPDPLGKSDSVVSVLRQNGVMDVDLNLRFRNKYLISSKTFSPGDFLRDVHMHSNVDDLQAGLSFLSQSINQKSSALKLLVSNNFDRFVLAKSTIDAVYKEMKTGSTNQGEEGEEGTFRLVKEDEWGIKSIRTPLNEAQSQAGVVFGPVLENQGREEKLRVVLRSIDRYRDVLDISNIIVDAIKRKDYDALKEEYFRAKTTVNAARAILVPGRSPSELEIHRVIIAERMWAEVEEVIEDYKRETFRRLMETNQSDNFLDLIS
ncbi:hypothetical protein ABW19_dt0200140 [Dactylella cylindrospora]|nr:hypothetical protein ABW19_dt0200140 [Dactylella cylindrospora]